MGSRLHVQGALEISREQYKISERPEIWVTLVRIGLQLNRQTTDWHMTDRQTDRQTGRQADRQAGRQTD